MASKSGISLNPHSLWMGLSNKHIICRKKDTSNHILLYRLTFFMFVKKFQNRYGAIRYAHQLSVQRHETMT